MRNDVHSISLIFGEIICKAKADILSQCDCRGRKKIGNDITICRVECKGATDSRISDWKSTIFSGVVGSMS